MLVISKEQVNNLIHRLNQPSQLSQCQGEVGKMLEIESALLWWAESGKCCRWQVGACLASEVQILEETLNSLKESNISQASSLLREYTNQLEQSKGEKSCG